MYLKVLYYPHFISVLYTLHVCVSLSVYTLSALSYYIASCSWLSCCCSYRVGSLGSGTGLQAFWNVAALPLRDASLSDLHCQHPRWEKWSVAEKEDFEGGHWHVSLRLVCVAQARRNGVTVLVTLWRLGCRDWQSRGLTQTQFPTGKTLCLFIRTEAESIANRTVLFSVSQPVKLPPSSGWASLIIISGP